MATATARKRRSTKRRKAGIELLAERVYQQLLERILDGRFSAGTIVSELALAAELSVSRTPIHAAVRQLVRDGLVTRDGRRRARIAAFTTEDVYEIFEMRKFLEGPAAELAAGRISPVDLASLRAIADELRHDPDRADWVERWADFDERFHRTIARAGGNRRLASDIDRYRLLHKGFNRVSTDRASLDRAMAEHLGILDALAACDGALARRRMVEHIEAWQDYFLRRVVQTAAADVRVTEGEP